MDKKVIKWFAASFGAAFGAAAGLTATAAPGDIAYLDEFGKSACVTKEQAACFGQCAVNLGAWTGGAADTTYIRIQQIPACGDDGREVYVEGVKTAPPDKMPEGAKVVPVVGVVE